MKSRTPEVSIIVPSRNKEKFIVRTLESVMAQSFGDFEAIVIDNCSKDGSRRIVSEMSKMDPRIHLVENDQDFGIVYSLNRGLSLARGRFICVLHCDDLWETNFLSSSIELFSKNPSAGLLFCRYKNIDETGAPHQIPARNRLEGGSRQIASKDMFGMLLERDFIPVCTVMVRREAHTNCGAYDMQFPGPSDYQMWLKITCRFDAIYNSGSTSSYRIYGENDTNYLIDNNISIMEQYSMVKKLFREFVPRSEKSVLQEKTMLRNASLSLLRQAVNSISRGKGALCRSQCGLAMAVWGGLPLHVVAWILYMISFLAFAISPLVRIALRASMPLFRKAGLY